MKEKLSRSSDPQDRSAGLALCYAGQAGSYGMADSILPPENVLAVLPAELSRGLFEKAPVTRLAADQMLFLAGDAGDSLLSRRAGYYCLENKAAIQREASM